MNPPALPPWRAGEVDSGQRGLETQADLLFNNVEGAKPRAQARVGSVRKARSPPRHRDEIIEYSIGTFFRRIATVENSTGVRVMGSSERAHTVDALATTGDERRDSLRKAPGSWQINPDPEISEWGNPPARVSRTESIRPGSEPGELKHLSTRRNRNQPRFRQ